jgi:nucleoside-diphosphate-sugar epimerase
VGTIVHCAASTKFTLPLSASRKVNVHGTKNVLELAQSVKELKLLLHISTAYVAGRRTGFLHEAQFAHADGWFNPYEQSKFEAERLVIEKGGGIPWAIVRLSTIVGNSLTGKVSQFNYFHQLLRIVPTNPFPVIPGAPQTPVDVVADDWVVEGLDAIMRGQPAPGSVFHLCAGPLQALPAQEVVELAFRLHHQQQPGSASRTPAFVSLGEFQALAKGLRRTGQTGLSRMAELLLLYLPHLDVHQSFLNENTNSFLEDAGISALRTHDFLPRIVQACF